MPLVFLTLPFSDTIQEFNLYICNDRCCKLQDDDDDGNHNEKD